MENSDFKKLLHFANLSKKEFALLFNLSQTTVNGWGQNNKKFPYWVESWLKNYIELQTYKVHYSDCQDELRKANDFIHTLQGEPLGISSNTSNADISLAEMINKISDKPITEVSNIETIDLMKRFTDELSSLKEKLGDLEKLSKK